MKDVEEFLKKLNLEQYVQNFDEVGYDDMEVITNCMTFEKLCEIGISKLGHRDKIMMAIERSRQCASISSSVSASTHAVMPESSRFTPRALPPKLHFHRRVLPTTCISFSSEEGKKLFTEALVKGHMDSYFKLASQFRTQDEPAFCGLSTMVMVLNALDVDPGRIWKGPWRWYHENMLDCCVPLEIVEQRGITFEQFLCVASCNYLNVVPTRMVEGSMTIDKFRSIVREHTKQDDVFVVLSYSRAVLDQTGDGHFSPIGGYHPERDLVLMLDTARFKYPPHWVPLPLLYQAMQALDNETGKPRGLFLMSRRKKRQQLLLFRLASTMSLTASDITHSEIAKFMKRLTQNLHEDSEVTSMDDLAEKAVSDMVNLLQEVKGNAMILTTQLDIKCPEDVAKQQECVIHRLSNNLEKTLVFQKISQIFTSIPAEVKEKVGSLFGAAGKCCGERCQIYDHIESRHFLAILVLSWPYSTDVQGERTLGVLYDRMVESVLEKDQSGGLLSEEVHALRDQLDVFNDVFVKNTTGVATCCKNKRAKTDSCELQM